MPYQTYRQKLHPADGWHLVQGYMEHWDQWVVGFGKPSPPIIFTRVATQEEANELFLALDRGELVDDVEWEEVPAHVRAKWEGDE